MFLRADQIISIEVVNPDECYSYIEIGLTNGTNIIRRGAEVQLRAIEAELINCIKGIVSEEAIILINDKDFEHDDSDIN